jgi:hypothetical protein
MLSTLLLKAKKLRGHQDFDEIFISPDLTEAERLEDKELRMKRDELNKNRDPEAPFRYAIRGNQIVRFKSDQTRAAAATN